MGSGASYTALRSLRAPSPGIRNLDACRKRRRSSRQSSHRRAASFLERISSEGEPRWSDFLVSTTRQQHFAARHSRPLYAALFRSGHGGCPLGRYPRPECPNLAPFGGANHSRERPPIGGKRTKSPHAPIVRGRDASYLAPPAQIRTCSFPAYGLYGAFFVKGISHLFVLLLHSFVRPAARTFFRPDRISPSPSRAATVTGTLGRRVSGR